MRLVFAILALQILLGCNSSTNKPLKKHSYTNELINESSPYLLQHAHNPVNWKAWNETTLQQAKEERKL